MKNIKVHAPKIMVKLFKKGEHATPIAYQPGDFIITHGKSWTSDLIRFGQRLRFKGNDAQYAYWNHVALIVSGDGKIIEALGAGVSMRSLEDYKNEEYLIVQTIASDEDRSEACFFANRCLNLEYNYSVIISIALSLLTGLKFSFGFDGQFICSGLVARALERTTAIFDKEPSHIMPADLAKYYLTDVYDK